MERFVRLKRPHYLRADERFGTETCLRCNYTWPKRFRERPKACPRCKSPSWDERRRSY